MIQRQITYVEATNARDRTVIASLDLLDVEKDGVLKPCVTVEVPGKSRVAVDIDDYVASALYGRHAGIFGDLVGTLLSAKANATATALSVLSITGFSDGDPVAIFNAEGNAPEYRLISGAPAGSTINIGSGLTSVKYKGAFVVSLAGRQFGSGRGYNYQQGVKPQLQAPLPVEIDVEDGTGDTIDVTVTLTYTQDEATHFDLYVRGEEFSRIEPNWQPDLADQTSVASTLNVATYEGGTDCVPDGTGGSLASAQTVWVAMVAKNGAGQMGVDESILSNVVQITLD
uniref:Uncharacterized protein n=1 Tax=viral metagenome TaxID=1070528 RepID=A0A6M3IJ75_9ZZZZ